MLSRLSPSATSTEKVLLSPRSKVRVPASNLLLKPSAVANFLVSFSALASWVTARSKFVLPTPFAAVTLKIWFDDDWVVVILWTLKASVSLVIEVMALWNVDSALLNEATPDSSMVFAFALAVVCLVTCLFLRLTS